MPRSRLRECISHWRTSRPVPPFFSSGAMLVFQNSKTAWELRVLFFSYFESPSHTSTRRCLPHISLRTQRTPRFIKLSKARLVRASGLKFRYLLTAQIAISIRNVDRNHPDCLRRSGYEKRARQYTRDRYYPGACESFFLFFPWDSAPLCDLTPTSKTLVLSLPK